MWRRFSPCRVVLRHGRTARVIIGGVLVVVAAAAMFLVARAVRRTPWARRVRTMSHEPRLGSRPAGLIARLFIVCLAAPTDSARRSSSPDSRSAQWLRCSANLAVSPSNSSASARALPSRCSSCTSVRRSTSEHCSAPQGARAGRRARGLRRSRFTSSAAVVWRLPVAMGLLASAQLGVPAAVVSIGLATKQITAAQGAAVMAALAAHAGGVCCGCVRCSARRPLTDASAPATST